MSRLARRIQQAEFDAGSCFDTDQFFLETALRGKSARKVRASLRRMDPVIVLTPRWSVPGQFLEDLALDLAVGEPNIGCRTVSFRGIKGRSPSELWQHVLHIFRQLGHKGWRHSVPQTIVDRRGFRWSLEQVLEEAHAITQHRIALLAHGAENLPLEIIEDVRHAWMSYIERHPEGRRCTLLLAGRVDSHWLTFGNAQRIELADYSEAEAAAALVGRAGPLPIHQLEQVARFSGGVPSIVRQIGENARRHGRLPLMRDELLGCLGPLANEMRGAVDIVAADSVLADRLHALLSGDSLPMEDTLDRPLLVAGLIRQQRGIGGLEVRLRAPAIAALVG